MAFVSNLDRLEYKWVAGPRPKCGGSDLDPREHFGRNLALSELTSSASRQHKTNNHEGRPGAALLQGMFI